MLWHLFSLDAPTVAAVWTAFVGWTAGMEVPWMQVAAMFIAVWILYAGDRLLDARPLFTAASGADLEERHHFHHRHRRAFLTGVALAALPLLFLLHKSPEPVLHLYVLLAVLLGLWLLLVHVRPAASATSHRLPKELAVGMFFPAAVFIPTVGRSPVLRPALLPCALAFAALCSLNCLFLFAWEHPGRVNHAHASTRWAVRHLQTLAVGTAVVGDAALYFLWGVLPGSYFRSRATALPHPAALFLACALSGLSLLLLHRNRHRIAPLPLRALADGVLLTPVLVVLVYRALQHA